MKPIQTIWKSTATRFVALIPEKFRIPAAALLVIGVILIGAFASEESLNNTRDNRAVSLFGLLVFIFVLWVTSKHRAHVKWHTVIVGMLMQFIIALFVLRTSVGYDIFNFVSDLARSLLGYAHDGVAFLTSADIAESPMFFFSVLPAIIFFVSIVQLVISPSCTAVSEHSIRFCINGRMLTSRTIALSLGSSPMVYRKIRCFLLLVHASIRS